MVLHRPRKVRTDDRRRLGADQCRGPIQRNTVRPDDLAYGLVVNANHRISLGKLSLLRKTDALGDVRSCLE
jgi:hypothetical protein